MGAVVTAGSPLHHLCIDIPLGDICLVLSTGNGEEKKCSIVYNQQLYYMKTLDAV